MSDLFAAEKPPAQAGGTPARQAPSLHSDTEIYAAVEQLGAYVLRATSHIQRGMKSLIGEALIYETTEMAELVRLANIARGQSKVPHLDELLGRLEKVKFLLRQANTAEFLPHRTYAPSIKLTDSISMQAYGLRKKYAPAASPAT